jgi:hypothetical protein
MENLNEKATSKIRPNFWIYLLTCLIVIGVPIHFWSWDSATQTYNIYNIILGLVQMLVFSSLAWIIGKKYRLNYIWICILAFLGFCTLPAINFLQFLSYNGFSANRLSGLVLGIILIIFSSLIFAFIAVIISYPFQLLFSKKYHQQTPIRDNKI